MRTFTRFSLGLLLWAGLILVLFVPITLLSGATDFDAVKLLRWFGHSFSLAALPAGIMVARDVEQQPRRALLDAGLASLLFAFFVWALLGIVAPVMNGDPDFFRALAAMRGSGPDWLAYNQNAWGFAMTVSETLATLLYAAIGVQLGIWASRTLPPALRRTLYWAVAFAMLHISYMIGDVVYEHVVVRTNGPVAFAGLLGLLLPLGVCAGLLLPTWSTLRD